MLAIFKLNVHDLPFPLPLGRPPSKQSDQPKVWWGIPFFRLCYPHWGFLSLVPSPPQSCRRELAPASTAPSHTLQPVRASAGTSPDPFNQELQEYPTNQEWKKCCFQMEEITFSPTSQTIIQNAFFPETLTPSYIAP